MFFIVFGQQQRSVAMVTQDRCGGRVYNTKLLLKKTLLYTVHGCIWRKDQGSGSLRCMHWAMYHLTTALGFWIWPHLFALQGKVQLWLVQFSHHSSLSLSLCFPVCPHVSVFLLLPHFVTIPRLFQPVWRLPHINSKICFLNVFFNSTLPPSSLPTSPPLSGLGVERYGSLRGQTSFP